MSLSRPRSRRPSPAAGFPVALGTAAQLRKRLSASVRPAFDVSLEAMFPRVTEHTEAQLLAVLRHVRPASLGVYVFGGVGFPSLKETLRVLRISPNTYGQTDCTLPAMQRIQGILDTRRPDKRIHTERQALEAEKARLESRLAEINTALEAL